MGVPSAWAAAIGRIGWRLLLWQSVCLTKPLSSRPVEFAHFSDGQVNERAWEPSNSLPTLQRRSGIDDFDLIWTLMERNATVSLVAIVARSYHSGCGCHARKSRTSNRPKSSNNTAHGSESRCIRSLMRTQVDTAVSSSCATPVHYRRKPKAIAGFVRRNLRHKSACKVPERVFEWCQNLVPPVTGFHNRVAVYSQPSPRDCRAGERPPLQIQQSSRSRRC